MTHVNSLREGGFTWPTVQAVIHFTENFCTLLMYIMLPWDYLQNFSPAAQQTWRFCNSPKKKLPQLLREGEKAWNYIFRFYRLKSTFYINVCFYGEKHKTFYRRKVQTSIFCQKPWRHSLDRGETQLLGGGEYCIYFPNIRLKNIKLFSSHNNLYFPCLVAIYLYDIFS